MIRIILTSTDKVYGYDVTGYENKNSESGWYDNLLTEEWCENNEYNYELVEPDDNN